MSLLGYAALLLCWVHCAAQRACEGPPPRRVKEVPTKSWDKPPYPHGTQAIYNCRPGYVKAGRVGFRCNDGVWQELNPGTECRNKPCGHPGDTDFGFFELTSGTEFVFGARVEYRCNDGYQMLSQRNYRECQANGWSNDIPHCEVIKCLPVQEPENGRIIMTGAFELGQEYSFGQVVNFECNAKYKLVGAKEIVCSANGEWSSDVPQCKEINCDVPKIPHGYVRSSKESYKENELMQYFCEEGYKYGNKADALCTASGWNPPPYCTEVECSPPVISSGNFSPQKDKYIAGDSITVQCDDGYRFKAMTGRSTAECTKNGWVPEPACVRKPCEYPAIENGKLNYQYEDHRNRYFPIGQSVYYSCHHGYSTPTRDWVQITCTARGWSPEPKCLKKCFREQLEGGNFPYHWSGYFLEGDTARYTCYQDFQAQHNEVTCTRNGWAPRPRCTRKKSCKAFFSENILIHHTNKTMFMPEDTIEYSCLEGYRTTKNMPTETTTCGKNGEWSPEPECRDVSCGAAPEIPNARMADAPQERYPPGARVHYQCERNFEMRGANYILCSNGQWSEAPVCRDVRCDPPLQIPGGTIDGTRKSKYMPGESAKYRCRKHFKMTGPSTVVCKNGTWTELPTCKGEGGRCGRPPAIQSGEPLHFPLDEYQEGATVEYQCPNFYILKGSPTITCRNGQWTDPPVCLAACTTSEEDMARNNIELKWSNQAKLYTSSGDVIEFRCKRGYFKHPQSPDFRVPCVEGTVNYPRCTLGMVCTASEEDMNRNNIELKWRNQAKLYTSSGDVIEFRCKQGYFKHPDSPDFRVPCVDGTVNYPHCTLGMACTTSEEDLNRNNIELKWRNQAKLYTKSGDVIEFRCKQGYFKHPNSPDFRAQCVEGTVNYPRCTLRNNCFLDHSTMEKNNIQLQSRRQSRPHYVSGDPVVFECKPGFWPVSQREEFSTQCVDGVISYPVCQELSSFG